MEASKHRQIPRRLLAFALTVILVLSLLPANLLTVWADTGDITIHIDQDREGKLYLVLDDTETELELEQDQVEVTINPDNYSKIKLKMEPVNGNQVAVYARVGNHDTEVNKKNETPFVVTLKDQGTNNITGNLFDDDTLYIVVVFGQLFKALPGQGDVTITAQGYYLPSETAITLPEEGLKLNEKQLVTSPSDPANNGVKVTVKPVDGCAIQSVNINGATQITLNGDGQFTLKKNYFNADGIAVINAVTTGTPTAEPYKLDPVTLENCTATITRGSNEPEELASGAEITAEELTAENVTLIFTGISESYKVSSVKINNQEKAESEVGAASFSYALKQADFGTEKTIGVSAVFAEPDQPTPDYTLHFAMSGGEGTATIKKKNAGEQTESLTDGMGLYAADLPAVLTFTAPEDMVLDELVIGSTTITYPANQNKSSDTFELKAEHFQNGSLTISVSFREPYVAEPAKLVIGSPSDYSVWIQNSDESYSSTPNTGSPELGLPAHIKITPAYGKQITGVKLQAADGTEKTVEYTAGDEGEVYIDLTEADFAEGKTQTLVVTTEDLPTFEVSFNIDPGEWVSGHTMTYNGETSTTTVTVLQGGLVDVLIEANDGYVVHDVRLNDNFYQRFDTKQASFNLVISEQTFISADFLHTYQLSLAEDSSAKAQVTAAVKHSGEENYQTGTEITAEAPLDVLSGDSAKVTVTADDGYLLTGVKDGDNAPAGLTMDAASATFELSNISANHTIKVETAEAVTVTAKTLAHATIKLSSGSFVAETSATEDAVLTVPEDADVQVELTLEDGYAVTSLKVNEADYTTYTVNGNVVSFTLSSVSEDQTIEAAVEKSYTIQLNDYSNGSVTAAGYTVSAGNSLTLTESELLGADLVFTANSGYAIYSLQVKTSVTDAYKKTAHTYQLPTDETELANLFGETNTLNVIVNFQQTYTLRFGEIKNCKVYNSSSETIQYQQNAEIPVFANETVNLYAKPSQSKYAWAGIKINGTSVNDTPFTPVSDGAVNFSVTIKESYISGNGTITIGVYFNKPASLDDIIFLRDGDDITEIRKYTDAARLVYVFDNSGPLTMQYKGYTNQYSLYFNNKDLGHPTGDEYKVVRQNKHITYLEYDVWEYNNYMDPWWWTVDLPSDGFYVVLDNVAPAAKTDDGTDVATYYANHYYSAATTIDLTVFDPECTYRQGDETKTVPQGFSGLASVKIYVNDELKTEDTINTKPASKTYSVDIPQPTEGDAVHVRIEAADNAGNERAGENAIEFDVLFNLTPPDVELSFSAEDPVVTNEKGTFYPNGRRATITVWDKAVTFKGLEGIAFEGTAQNSQGNDVSDYLTLEGEGWTHSTEPDENGRLQYTANVSFAEANYALTKISYTNGANAKAEKTLNKTFTVDTTPPTGTVTVQDKGFWSELLETLTFGLWSDNEVLVSAADLADNLSGVKGVKYYVQEFADDSGETDALLDEDALNALPESAWTEYTDSFYVSTNKRFVVYLRIEDWAGKVGYACTDGLITDNQTANTEFILPETDYISEDGATKLYGRNEDAEGNPVETVDVEIKVTEPAVRSGIHTVDYLITTSPLNEEELPEEGWTNLFTDTPSNENGHPAYSELVKEFSNTTHPGQAIIPVPKADFNVCKVYVYVRTTDNAGNSKPDYKVIDIDYTAPVISGETEGNQLKVEIVERNEHFDPDAATQGIAIVAKNNDGEEVEIPWQVSDWANTPVEGAPDACVHTAYVSFGGDANISYTLNYTDKAGNKAIEKTGEFSVDTLAPVGEITIQDNTWDELLNALTFGLWSKAPEVVVSAEVSDATSGVKSVQYYVAFFTDESGSSDALMDQAALKGLSEDDWTDYEGPFTVPTNNRFVVYLRMEDNEGNFDFICSDGVIADSTPSTISFTLPETEYISEDGSTKLYGRNEDADGNPVETVDVEIKVTEPEIRSGIHTVDYLITTSLLNEEELPEEGWTNLFTDTPSNENGHPAYSELVKEFSNTTHPGQAIIPVPKADFNVCKVYVYVRTTDNAGNSEPDYEVIDIDYTAPVISGTVEEAVEGVSERKRIKVEIVERNEHFDPDAATQGIAIVATNNDGEEVEIPWQVSDWVNTPVEGAPDACVHTAYVTFGEDANISYTINYTDKAGNKAKEKTGEFSADTLPPVGEITIQDNTWDELLNVLTFGLWSNDPEVVVSAEVSDATSGVKSVQYYVAFFTDESGSSDALMDWETLAGLSEDDWTDYEDPFTVPTNNRFVVYLRMEDNEGNFDFICSDGVIADSTPSTISFTLPETDYTDGSTKLYGIDGGETVDVEIKVTEPEIRSGIHTVDYLITTSLLNEEELPEEGWTNLFTDTPSDENGHPAYSELVKEFSNTTHPGQAIIPVPKAEFNACRVYVYVKVADNAENVGVEHTFLDIDYTRPVIDVQYTTTQNNYAASDYYTSVSAAVTITERTEHFVPGNVKFVIKGVDINNQELDVQYQIEEWTTVRGKNPDEDKHTAAITFISDANYSLSITCTDLAGNKVESAYSKSFTKDATQPDGTLAIEDLTNDVWTNEIISYEKRFFALFSKEKVDVTHTASDAISPLVSVAYFETNRNGAPYIESELDNLSADSWKEVSEDKLAAGNYTVFPDARATVYLRVIDMAGNVRYVSTNGFILDKTPPKTETPKITIAQPASGIFNSNVPILLQVTDPKVNDSYSGLKEIRYEVRNMDTVTKREVITFPNSGKNQEDLRQSWQQEITIDSKENNSNNVVIWIHAVDNAGNESEASEQIKIDVTAPTVEVKYDKNNAQNGFYFNETRTATITITERNFNQSDVKLTVNTVGGAQPTLSAWQTKNAGGNGDDTQHTATLTFSADGDYTVDISFTDQAGNKNKEVNWVGTATQKFTIDKTAPVITVKTDDNAQNGNYYKENRVDTVTITEHNFDPNTVVIDVETNGTKPVLSAWSNNGDTHTATLTYSADGNYTVKLISNTDLAGNHTDYTELASKPFTVDHTAPKIEVSYNNNSVENEWYFKAVRTATIKVTEVNFNQNDVVIDVKTNGAPQPVLSSWNNDGSVHTATLSFTADGEYEFDVSCTDLAGNKNSDVAYSGAAPQKFTIDTTPPEVVLTGVENESANSGKDKIGFTLTATDTNFNEAQFLPVLTAYLYQDGVLDKRQIQLDSYLKDVENGKQIVIDDLAEDGVYVLTCTVVDRAGNAFTVFDRNDEKDIPANGTENIQLLIFSVNRNGSTFYANDYTIAVLKQYYVKSVDEPIVIYEINPDKLESHSVSLNGSAIDSEITEKTEENWYHYEYDIDKALFDAEGTYNLVVSSVDAAGNSAYSDLKGVKSQSGDGEFSVRFVVDRTAPIVTVSGLEDNGRYQTDAQTVTLVPADDGGLLGSLIVRVMDENGQLIDEPWNLQGEDLQKALKDNDGKISFTLAENPDQYYVYIECKDTADNETKLEFKEVTVSTSAFRIFWANKPLRWGSIGGLGGAAALFFFFLLAKKRKKKEDEVVPENKPEKKA